MGRRPHHGAHRNIWPVGQHAVLLACHGRRCSRRQDRRGVHHHGVGIDVVRWQGRRRVVLGLVLFVFIQASALALGLLSPSIHAARLHFVEWMGKFYDGSGRVFTRLAVAPSIRRGNHSPMDTKLEVEMNKNTLKMSLRTLIVLDRRLGRPRRCGCRRNDRYGCY